MLREIINKMFIESSYYMKMMVRELRDEDDLNNLAEVSENFNYRHGRLKEFGAWRWMSVFQYRDTIAEFVFNEELKGIDFGGWQDPIYGYTTIVDIVETEKVIEDIEHESLDYIYTSHTLEHVPDLDITLKQLHDRLKPDGVVIAIVPAYTCTRWRQENCPSHKRTFSLEDNGNIRIDLEFKKNNFKVYISKYAWDNCIFILARKP